MLVQRRGPSYQDFTDRPSDCGHWLIWRGGGELQVHCNTAWHLPVPWTGLPLCPTFFSLDFVQPL